MQQQTRRYGILIHPTSFPGPDGIGDFGPAAYRMLDYFADAGARVWQILPIGPTGGSDNSPYQLFSSFAGNPLLISLERLRDDGLLSWEELADRPAFPAECVDYPAVSAYKLRKLRDAFAVFCARNGQAREDYQAFCRDESWWLDDYALFTAAHAAHDDQPWTAWEDGLRRREPAALAAWHTQLAEETAFVRFTQFCFMTQWRALREHARHRGLQLIGDVPIFVAQDSADVWVHPELFHLDDAGIPTCVAGVPPDYFSPTGQRWGNPVYNWPAHEATGFAWWIDRIRHTLTLVDAVRIDHFRGFAAYWEIPASCPTAVDGQWVPAPGDALFAALHAKLGELPFIAENLGVITDDVEGLRERAGLPGMAVLQFAFSGEGKPNMFSPHRLTHDTVVYTGTHDNDTILGWWSRPENPDWLAREHHYIMEYLGVDDREINWTFIRTALAAVPVLAVIPLQDILSLGTETRMNFPGTVGNGNWCWRVREDQLDYGAQQRVRRLAELYER